MDFCEEFTMRHFLQKCAVVKFVKKWRSSHFSESRDPSYVGSAMCPECLRKDWWDKPCMATPSGKPPRGFSSTKGYDCISYLSWSRLGVESTELSDNAVDRELFLLQLLPPRLSPEEKRARKWMNKCKVFFKANHRLVQGIEITRGFPMEWGSGLEICPMSHR